MVVTVLNHHSGDRFRRAWDTPAVAQLLPLGAPQGLRQLANFHTLVRGALECEAGFSTAAGALGEGTEISGRSFEEHENYVVLMMLRTGDGPLASRHEVTLHVPIHQRASAETRHELALRRQRANFVEREANIRRDLDYVRSEARRTSTSLVGCTVLLGLCLAAVVLAQYQDDNSGSGSSASPTDPLRQLESARCLFHQLLHHPELYATTAEVAVAVFGALLLFIGWRLLGVLLFMCGFLCAAVLCLVLTESIFELADFSSCPLLGVATVCGGLLGGVVAHTGRAASFFLLGSLSGAVIGWYAYVLAVGTLTQHLREPAVWHWVTVCTPALVGGCLLASFHGQKALAISSSVVGACAVVVALDLLLLADDDRRFTAWLVLPHENIVHPPLVDPNLSDSVYVLGPVLAAVLLSIVGACFQCRYQSSPEQPAPVREVPVGLLNEPLLSRVDSAYGGGVVVAEAVADASVPIHAAVHVQASAPPPDA